MTIFHHLYFCEKLIKISILTRPSYSTFICKNYPKLKKFCTKNCRRFFIVCLYMYLYWCCRLNYEKKGGLFNHATFLQFFKWKFEYTGSESNSWIYYTEKFTGPNKVLLVLCRWSGAHREDCFCACPKPRPGFHVMSFFLCSMIWSERWLFVLLILLELLTITV